MYLEIDGYAKATNEWGGRLDYNFVQPVQLKVRDITPEHVIYGPEVWT